MAPSQNTGIGTAHHHLHTPTTTPVNHQHSHHCSDHRMQLQEDLVKNWMKFMGSEMEILEQKLADETGARLALEVRREKRK